MLVTYPIEGQYNISRRRDMLLAKVGETSTMSSKKFKQKTAGRNLASAPSPRICGVKACAVVASMASRWGRSVYQHAVAARDVGKVIAHKPGSGTAGRRARAPNNRETAASRACPAGSASRPARPPPRNPPPARRRRRPLVHTPGSGASSTLERYQNRGRTTSMSRPSRRRSTAPICHRPSLAPMVRASRLVKTRASLSRLSKKMQ